MWYSYKTCGGKEWVAKAACGNVMKRGQGDDEKHAEKGCALRFRELNPGILSDTSDIRDIKKIIEGQKWSSRVSAKFPFHQASDFPLSTIQLLGCPHGYGNPQMSIKRSRKIAGLLDDPGEEEGTPSRAQELQQEGGTKTDDGLGILVEWWRHLGF